MGSTAATCCRARCFRRGYGLPWGCSSVGRADALAPQGQGFESPQLHFPLGAACWPPPAPHPLRDRRRLVLCRKCLAGTVWISSSPAARRAASPSRRIGSAGSARPRRPAPDRAPRAPRRTEPLLGGALEAPHDAQERPAAVVALQQRDVGVDLRVGHRAVALSLPVEQRPEVGRASPQPGEAPAAAREGLHHPWPLEALDLDQRVQHGERAHRGRALRPPARTPRVRRCRAPPGGSARAPGRPPPRARSAPARSSCSRVRAAVGQAQAGQVEGDPAQPSGGQLAQHLAVEEGGRRHTVDADDGLAGSLLAHEAADAGRAEGPSRLPWRFTTSWAVTGDRTARPETAYAMLRQMSAGDLTLGEAARAIGVSADTLRRWERAGKLAPTRDPANRRRVPVRGRAAGHRPERHGPGARSRPATASRAWSARWRSTG